MKSQPKKEAAPRKKGHKPSGTGWGGARKGAGKPPLTFTDEQRFLVTVLAGAGVIQDDIALTINVRKPDGTLSQGIDRATLQKHFEFELRAGKSKLDAICIGGLAKAMLQGNLGAICFYAKTRLRWREGDSGYDPTADDGIKDFVTALRNSPRDETVPSGTKPLVM